ncbi:MAG: potassium transporter Kup [Jatrophihabitans sp.]|uniref:potassium transporter Kup n=1 Tax=Jatrophihabitans sp. TaxID=1932789 RepID=UPI003F80268F
MLGLAVGALGVVFGDIGTSPLYALQTVFAIDHHAVKVSTSDVYGALSLVFWSVTLVVSVKYVAFILRADNDGEGGVMALAALARRATARSRRKVVAAALLLGVIGASLFYGDSVITPAISVLSAVEGLEVASPHLKDAVLPIGIAILTVLFLVQRFGTHRVGRVFGPVMIVWFLAIAVAGVPEIVRHPAILKALSPTYIGSFIADHPYTAFIAMGAVVLAITGAEALYADMGHFGRAPIRRAWFVVVFPCLMLNYLGQGALVIHDHAAVGNPFYLLVPHWARVPMVVLATFATVIASQAVISGAYSVSRQAIRLGYLPNLTVRHTSKEESGQIYVPAVNWTLFGGVLVLIAAFRSSNKLATAYGLAVTGTFMITTVLFLIVARTVWHWAMWRLVVLGVVFGVIEVTYFAANVTKIVNGGWLPLLIALLVTTTMTTWQQGRRIVTQRRLGMEGSLQDFVEEMRTTNLTRVPGTAVYPHPTKQTTPLALRADVDFNHVLHERVVLVSVITLNTPYVPREERLEVDDLGYADDGISHLQVTFGFQDEQDLPDVLRQAVGMTPELDIDPERALWFLSRLSFEHSDAGGMARWRKRIFVGLAHNAANPAVNFNLPDDRTIVIGEHFEF